MVATRKMPPSQGSSHFPAVTQGCAPSSLTLGYYILGFQPIRCTMLCVIRPFDLVAPYGLLLGDFAAEVGTVDAEVFVRHLVFWSCCHKVLWERESNQCRRAPKGCRWAANPCRWAANLCRWAANPCRWAANLCR